MLIIVKNRNIEAGTQALFDFETLRRFDVFKVDATKRWGNALHEINDFIGCLRIDTNRETVNATELFEQKSLALHYRHRAFRTNIAKTKNCCSVADNRHSVLTNCELM